MRAIICWMYSSGTTSCCLGGNGYEIGVWSQEVMVHKLPLVHLSHLHPIISSQLFVVTNLTEVVVIMVLGFGHRGACKGTMSS